MKYFYCQSYQAFNMAIAMNLGEKIIVITASKNILKACEFLKITYVEHEAVSLSQIVKERRKVNKELNRISELIKDAELHYSHTQFAVFCFLLVDKHRKKGNDTVFHNLEYVYSKPNMSSVFNKNYLFTKFYQTIIKNSYHLPLEVRMSSKDSYMISLRNEYNNASSKVIDNKLEYYDLTLNMFQNISFEYENVENLFIAQTFSNEAFFDKVKIMELLPVINSSKVAVKNHPKLGRVEGLEKGKELPDFLPVEMFFQKVTRNIISFHSASLITASKFKDVNTISLLDIVKTKDPFMTRIKEDLILKSGNKILFPKSINEFKEMLYA